MAALNRPLTASYECHECVTIDTQEKEDHTFCGIMFPIKAKCILPVEKVLIHSLSVRGQLGHLTVWVSSEDITRNAQGIYQFSMHPQHWTMIYQKYHKPSPRLYQLLDLRSQRLQPIVLSPGQVRMVYIHSTLPGDEAIVYDNTDLNVPWSENSPRYQDDCIAIFSGRAHLSPQAFHQIPLWGWGNAWRDRREFVGQLQYGVVYKLWNPPLYNLYGSNFRSAVLAMLILQRTPEAPVSKLPDECLYYIMNICRWDWFGDNGRNMLQHVRARRRLFQRDMESHEGDVTMVSAPLNHDEEYDNNVVNDPSEPIVAAAQDWVMEIMQQQLGLNLENENEVDGEMDDDQETAWERANGYRPDNLLFSFHDGSSDEDESDDGQS